MTMQASKEELEAGRGYETLFVPALLAPWVKHLVKKADVREGAHVLDIACGTGVLARAAHKEIGTTGRVVGLDPARGMLATAKETNHDIEWILGSAESLPFEDSIFDCVLCQFGMMFFEDRRNATREMARVTKPGGRVAIAAWSAIEQNPTYAAIVAMLKEHVSPEAADAVSMPFCMGDPATVTDLLTQSGFSEIAVETTTETARFPSTRTLVEAELRGWLPLFGIHLSDDKIASLLEISDDSLSDYVTASGEAVFSSCAYVAHARKPT